MEQSLIRGLLENIPENMNTMELAGMILDQLPSELLVGFVDLIDKIPNVTVPPEFTAEELTAAEALSLSFLRLIVYLMQEAPEILGL